MILVNVFPARSTRTSSSSFDSLRCRPLFPLAIHETDPGRSVLASGLVEYFKIMERLTPSLPAQPLGFESLMPF
jgi:hypothetical protein